MLREALGQQSSIAIGVVCTSAVIIIAAAVTGHDLTIADSALGRAFSERQCVGPGGEHGAGPGRAVVMRARGVGGIVHGHRAEAVLVAVNQVRDEVGVLVVALSSQTS